MKVLPDDMGDYLVEVPNPNASQVDLRIYRYDDIKDDLDAPPADAVLKRWVVALASDNELEHRSTWVVSGEEVDTGTLQLSYAGGTDYSVDVYLDARDGAKVTSLRPGGEGQQVGVDYGYYTVHYFYWESDQNTAEGRTGIDWKESEVINGEEVPIWINLNDARSTSHLQIPHYGVDIEYGSITVVNSTARPLKIWAGPQPIEDVERITSGTSRTNRSTIMANDSMTYVLQAGDYRLIAKDLQTNAEVQSVDVSIADQGAFTWDLTTGDLTANLTISGVLPE